MATSIRIEDSVFLDVEGQSRDLFGEAAMSGEREGQAKA